MNINRICTLLLALCLISCSDEMEITNKWDSNSINFSIDVSNNNRTRVSTDSNFKTTFEEGDIIGIFIYCRNEGEESSIDENELYISNIKLIYKNGSWELERPFPHLCDRAAAFEPICRRYQACRSTASRAPKAPPVLFLRQGRTPRNIYRFLRTRVFLRSHTPCWQGRHPRLRRQDPERFPFPLGLPPLPSTRP